ncbi:MAG: hypothetical protein ACHQRM_01980 [Bacteroidia bacterium]
MLKLLPRNLVSFITAILVCSILIWGKCNNNFKDKVSLAITWDIYGYYLYLPSVFIYHDPDLENKVWLDKIQSQYPSSSYIYQYSLTKVNRRVNTYPMGLAIFYTPAFLIGHTIARIAGFPADGFSPPYQWALVISSMLFFCLAIFLLRRLLLHLFPDLLTSVLIVLVCLGTNYFFEAGLDSTMPHNYMFVLNCLLILFTMRWHETFHIRYAIFLAFTLGLATISRPTELIWILVPIFWGVSDKTSFHGKLTMLRTHFLQVIAFGVVLILTGLPQLLYWKWCSGYWFSYNHTEHFAFTEPFTWDFLFSYKKGWLVYTPLMIFSLLGFYSLYRNRRDLFYPFLIFITINIYVLSSWECWWYASSFGQRPMVESYPLLAIPLGFLIATAWKKGWLVRGSCLLLLSATLILNLFQTWQVTDGLLDLQRMTSSYYWKIFGKTSVSNEDRDKYLELDRGDWHGAFTGKEADFSKKVIFFRGYEDPCSDTDMHYVTDTIHYEGRKALKIQSPNIFASGIRRPYNDLTGHRHVWIRMTAAVYPVTGLDFKNIGFVASIESKGRAIDYVTYDMEQAKAKAGQWNLVCFDYMTPSLFYRSDKVDLYFMNLGKDPVFIDNLKFELWEPKDEP